MSETGPIFVTINPQIPPDPSLVQGRYTYAHPIIDAPALEAQRAIATIQNTRGISYAGAWMNFGFHEDGFTAGMMAAKSIGGDVRMPFELEEMEGSSWRSQNPGKRRLNGRQGREWWDEVAVFALAWIFWFMEASGWRPMVALLLSSLLEALRRLLDVTL